MRSFKELFIHFRSMKHYFIAAAIVFIAGIYLGYSNFHAISDRNLQGLGNIVDKINKTEHPQMWFFIFIFLNNAIKSVLFIYLGAFFGILPLYILLINGMILGYLASLQVQAGDSLFYLMKGILPHGIIEIPAVIIACAYGMKLGLLLVKRLILLPSKSLSTKVQGDLKHLIRMSVPLMIFITVALCIAAVIESTVTYSLMKS